MKQPTEVLETSVGYPAKNRLSKELLTFPFIVESNLRGLGDLEGFVKEIGYSSV
ncbi:hypothetical protein [Jiulongibacter sediminis]|jgi:hypothetical protein|uniref:hypothetical protein n=1 Tax=Jiulongibacter sediminis TaxID=1605367 RepID=UPI0026EE0B35|nr:hypothetical protein [Jiulongibacter sediminis]